MAFLTITEYSHSGSDIRSQMMMAPAEPAVYDSNLAISAGSVQSKIFDPLTRFVRIHAEAQAYLAFGKDPTATVGLHSIGAGETEYYTVSPGDRLAAISG